ncbi:hypothetical protein BE17_24675 [Sorangium cellulosum]|uniref:Sigma-54 factor interaction domain-containing protein n=1 Tax=Sorangium cellulosum TaxID=56 RepID=A0A150S8I7_SORCE|nr:hypothetical protein BE17_24675 [Sorangium cellulosum]
MEEAWIETNVEAALPQGGLSREEIGRALRDAFELARSQEGRALLLACDDEEAGALYAAQLEALFPGEPVVRLGRGAAPSPLALGAARAVIGTLDQLEAIEDELPLATGILRVPEEREADVEVVCASHLPLEVLRARLDADLFDRVSLLLVEIPPLRDCREDLREDWDRVWREARSSEELPREAPWSATMAQALGKDRLSGNLRDLQRLALVLMASAGRSADARWVEDGLAEWLALQARFAAAEEGGTQGEGDLGTGTWKEQVKAFQQRLARAAYREHKSYVAAAKALRVNERTLREHATAEED